MNILLIQVWLASEYSRIDNDVNVGSELRDNSVSVPETLRTCAWIHGFKGEMFNSTCIDLNIHNVIHKRVTCTCTHHQRLY